MNAAVGRRLPAEFTGTGLFVAVVAGSGIAATRLTTDGALWLLINSLVTSPVYPSKRYEDWDLPDPAGQDIDTVRRIRDQIRGHVQALADQLLSTAQPNTTAGER